MCWKILSFIENRFHQKIWRNGGDLRTFVCVLGKQRVRRAFWAIPQNSKLKHLNSEIKIYSIYNHVGVCNNLLWGQHKVIYGLKKGKTADKSILLRFNIQMYWMPATTVTTVLPKRNDFIDCCQKLLHLYDIIIYITSWVSHALLAFYTTISACVKYKARWRF